MPLRSPLAPPDTQHPVGFTGTGGLVMVVTTQESWFRSLESILGPLGYAVLFVSTRTKALSTIRTAAPVAVIVQWDLDDRGGADLCRTLREEPHLDTFVPIFLTSSLPFTREQRLTGLQSGAWECYTIPFDAAEFVAKLGNFVRVKWEAERARAESITAYGTAFYSRGGLLRVGQCLLAHAIRRSESLAVVVFGAGWLSGGDAVEVAKVDETDGRTPLTPLVRILAVAGRAEDCVGFLSGDELALVAAESGGDEAVRIAERLLAATDSIDFAAYGKPGTRGYRLVAGCTSLGTRPSRSMTIETLLERARAACLKARRQPDLARIVPAPP